MFHSVIFKKEVTPHITMWHNSKNNTLKRDSYEPILRDYY